MTSVPTTEPKPGRHWRTRWDPSDGQPVGQLCDCPIGADHLDADQAPPDAWTQRLLEQMPQILAGVLSDLHVHVDRLFRLRSVVTDQDVVVCDVTEISVSGAESSCRVALDIRRLDAGEEALSG